LKKNYALKYDVSDIRKDMKEMVQFQDFDIIQEEFTKFKKMIKEVLTIEILNKKLHMMSSIFE